jgi:hypothetical protein
LYSTIATARWIDEWTLGAEAIEKDLGSITGIKSSKYLMGILTDEKS